ncbi:MAG: histidine kinase [Pseudomonadota bacterium]
MSADIRLSRALIVRWLINLLVLTMAASCLSATTAIPSLPAAFEDVRHAAWRAEDGAPANVQGVVQSADGFLWIASATGLYRFDGLTFERIPLEGGNGKQSLQVASVAAAPNGDVWVGYDWGGMAVYHAGHLRPSNPGEPSKASVYLAVTRDGAVWARAPGRRGNRIVRFKGGVWEDIDERWNLPIGTGSIAMLVARDGSLYLLCPDGLRRLRQGARRFDFQPLSLGDGPTLAQDPAGRIWIADADRLARVEMGKGQVGPVTALPHSEMYRRLAFASDGAAWLAGAEDGVRRLSPDASGERFTGGQNLFGGSLGLSSGVTLSIAGDNEDNIWIGTLLGIDRFSMRRFARSVELPLSYAFDAYSAPNGETYLISNHALFRIGPRGPERLAHIRSAETLCGNKRHIIVATPYDLYSYKAGKVQKMPLPGPASGGAEGIIRACAFDEAGRLYLSIAHRPLYRLEKAGWRTIVPVTPATREGAYGLVPQADGAMLAIFPQDQILRIEEARHAQLWSARDGGAIGFIKTATKGRYCLLLGAQDGMGCLAGRTMRTLGAQAYPQLSNVTGIVETPQGWTWMIALQGIIRVRTEDLAAAFERPGRPLHFQRFGAEDALRGETMMMYPRDAVADRFGKIWFFTSKGLIKIDLSSVEARRPAPGVVIRSITANGRSYDASGPLVLPVGTRSIEIDYTATTLTDPKGTSFRYRLEGVDADWVEAGDRRQAFYTMLSPRQYRFHVVAVSSAGMPSKTMSTMDISIRPGFLQTRSFAIICVVMVILIGTVGYQWRLRSMARRLGERMQERLDERERIARELHDTLLQGVSGLLLQFQILASRVPRSEALRTDMEDALDRAEDLVVEGRNRVRSLRSNDAPRDLEEVIALALMQPGLSKALDVRMTRTGPVRPITGQAADELAAIVIEASGNALRHGHATTFVVRMAHDDRELHIVLEDDGCGIAQEVLAAGGRPGHFGLTGMRERAGRLGGTLLIGKGADRGTRIDIRIPGRRAYPARGSIFRFLRRKPMRS